LFQDAFPISLQNDSREVIAIMPKKTYNNVRIGTSEEYVKYSLNDVPIRFPYRIYYNEISDDGIIYQLSEQQKMILHCIYSRSCNGFVRENHIKSLLTMPYEDWAIPFIVKVCDEYVVEILEIVYKMLTEEDTERMKAFCAENRIMFCKSYAQMTSYWNEFYRDKYYHFKDYIGRKLFKECFGYSRSMERGN